MRRLLVFAALCLAACSPPGGTAYVRAYAAGDRAYSAGRFAEAADAYESAAKTASRDRDRDEAHYAAATSKARAGDVEGALKLFDALVAENPPGERSTRAAYEAAKLRIAHGHEAAGYAGLEALIAKDPEHGISHKAMRDVAQHLEETKGEAAAIEWEEKLGERFRSTRLGEEVCYDLATRKEKKGDDKAALGAFLACADAYPYPKGALWDDALWHASLLHEKLGDPAAAIADLRRMLTSREISYMNGSYNRPRMSPAQFRIAELTRDGLHDEAAARREFHRVYTDHPSSLLRPRALFEEAKLAQAKGDAQACDLARTILKEFSDTRWARRADQVCPAVAKDAEALRKAQADRRNKGQKTTGGDED